MRDIRSIVSKASARHILGKSEPTYVERFIGAFETAYGSKRWEGVLQHKFFLPDESRYSDQAYYQSASELSVANHVRGKGVQDFAVDKAVNPKSRKNVDVYLRIPPVIVSLEVKCPAEAEQPTVSATGNPVLLLQTAGRIPDFASQLAQLQADINSSGSMTAVIGKKKDATHKGFLLSANEKFDPRSGVDNLNILFIAGGSWGNMGEWYMHLYAGQGLFTASPFHSSSDFELVDVVILSNLKYWHQYARDYYDWTLNNVLIIPRVNPHGRKSLMTDMTNRGLAVFDHHLKRFNSFTEIEDVSVPENMVSSLKLNHYVGKELTAEEKKKYFPVNIYGTPWP